MTDEERNEFLEKLAYEIADQKDSPGALKRGLRQHSCSSCGLDDIEQAEVNGWNKAMDRVALFLRGKKASKALDLNT